MDINDSLDDSCSKNDEKFNLYKEEFKKIRESIDEIEESTKDYKSSSKRSNKSVDKEKISNPEIQVFGVSELNLLEENENIEGKSKKSVEKRNNDSIDITLVRSGKTNKNYSINITKNTVILINKIY